MTETVTAGAEAPAEKPKKPTAKEKKAASAAKIKAANDAKKAENKARADAKKKADAEKTASQKAAEQAKREASWNKFLDPLAKEINVRFDKAAKLESDADDHRLAAAIQLAKARGFCDDNKINFKTWAGSNVPQAYETVRKLVAVGKSPEPAKALADMRGKNKDANKALRDKKAEVASTALPASNPIDDTQGGVAPVFSSVEREQQQQELSGAEAVIAAFDLLRASEKMKVAEHAAEAVGATLSY